MSVRPANHDNRAGYTLLEVVVVMTATSVLAALMIPPLAKLTRGAAEARRSVATVAAIDRMALRFRDDIRQATRITLGAQKIELQQERVSIKDAQDASSGQAVLATTVLVTYRVEDEHLHREEATGGRLLRDAFALPLQTTFEFVRSDDENGELMVGLVVRLPIRIGGQRTHRSTEIVCEALVGADTIAKGTTVENAEPK